APDERDDLPQVAQYLAEIQDERFPRGELITYLEGEILRRHGAKLRGRIDEATLADLSREARLQALISAVGEALRDSNTKEPDKNKPAEPHAILASLPCPIYITTNPDNLMADALRAAKKVPQVQVFDWRSEVQSGPLIEPFDRLSPKAERAPLVYHLFGCLDQVDSLVLTEDDYFDYLINFAVKRDVVPEAIRRSLTGSSLLFLGFRVDEWDFRVLFRSIMNREGAVRLKKPQFAHVAVQIDPEQGRVLEPELARRYLEGYFSGAQITIYWGTASKFLTQLSEKWESAKRAQAALV
ncbi:MAG: SIR2 family protein, partial [Isosphaerales bacterium]